MTYYYLDIETCRQSVNNNPMDSIDPHKGKIITIQFQEINRGGEPIGDLNIFKEWESSERDIVSKFLNIFDLNNIWNFIPVGYNLDFEFDFLRHKFTEVTGKRIEPHFLLKNKPRIDLRHSVLMANNCIFSGSSLSNFSSKMHKGDVIRGLYETGMYNDIENYVKNEAKGFLEIFQKMVRIMPRILPRKEG